MAFHVRVRTVSVSSDYDNDKCLPFWKDDFLINDKWKCGNLIIHQQILKSSHNFTLRQWHIQTSLQPLKVLIHRIISLICDISIFMKLTFFMVFLIACSSLLWVGWFGWSLDPTTFNQLILRFSSGMELNEFSKPNIQIVEHFHCMMVGLD